MTMPPTPEKPADMSEAELRRWNCRHDLVSMNETDRAAGKRLIECLRKRSASDAWHAEGVNRLRFDGEILQRLISKYPPRAKHRQRRAEAVTDEDQVSSGRAVDQDRSDLRPNRVECFAKTLVDIICAHCEIEVGHPIRNDQRIGPGKRYDQRSIP